MEKERNKKSLSACIAYVYILHVYRQGLGSLQLPCAAAIARALVRGRLVKLHPIFSFSLCTIYIGYIVLDILLLVVPSLLPDAAGSVSFFFSFREQKVRCSSYQGFADGLVMRSARVNFFC